MSNAVAIPQAEDQTALRNTRKIRVLHLIHSVCHGGIESSMINWIRYMDRENFDVHVACFAGDRNREEPFLRAAGMAGFSVLSVPWTKYKPFLKAARALAKLVREYQIDVIHTHAYYADVLGALVKMFVPVKTVATVYIWGKYELHRQIMQAMDWTALHFVDKVTAHCDDTYKKTIRLGFSPKQVSTLITGFPAREHTPLRGAARLAHRRNLGIQDDEILLLNIARIHPEKAHDQLLRSFQLVHAKYPKTRLWISGTGWQYLEDELDALRKELGIEHAAEVIGFKQELWPLLDAADMMVHPSHVEGVPMAIQYGMAAELPIVISDVGGIREIIKDGRTGVLVPENDIEGFAQTVIALLEDKQRAQQLGRGARDFVLNEYSIETAVMRIADTYREVLAR
jgi:glycosyltransferase involved in cell wall biosynthesis